MAGDRRTISAVDWVELTADALPVEKAMRFVAASDCGAQLLFSGLVRDHAEGRHGVEWVDYEAYEEETVPRMRALIDAARSKWPMLGPVAVLHRTGRLEVGEVSVLVAVASPHRAEAFDAGRYLIDTLKATLPIWKRESWEGGEDWGTGAQPVQEVHPQ